MRRFLILAFTRLLANCTTRTRITDTTSKSTVYGWVDVDKIRGYRLFGMQLRQYSPQNDKPYDNVAVSEFEGGSIFWTDGGHPGGIEFHDMRLQSCLVVMRTNTIAIYDFGTAIRQGNDHVCRRRLCGQLCV